MEYRQVWSTNAELHFQNHPAPTAIFLLPRHQLTVKIRTLVTDTTWEFHGKQTPPVIHSFRNQFFETFLFFLGEFSFSLNFPDVVEAVVVGVGVVVLVHVC